MVLLRFNKKDKEWKEIPQEKRKEHDLYLDGKLKNKLDFAKRHRKRNNDVIGIVEGKEGSGKSSLAGNIMRYVTNDSFDPTKDMIGSDYEDAINKIDKVKNSGHLMFDEGNVFFLSTETIKREHRDLHKLFSIFRQKNLFVLIVLPSFFRLGTYFALDRSNFMVRTYLKNGKRGYLGYYGEKTKANLYKKGKAKYDIHVVEPNFRGRFTKCYLLETKEYHDFKISTLKQSFVVARAPLRKKKSAAEIKREVMYKLIEDNPELTSPKLSLIIGMDDSRIRAIRREMKSYKKPLINT